jgi:MoaA/NifB/PqqE/SkfB family radical SAM enzyme
VHIRFAQVEPTTRCNFTCGFCAGRHMPQQDLPLDRFREFIDRVEGLEALELQGEGEPLLNPDFFAMIALARRKFPAVEISLISNGSLFTPEHIEQLLTHRVARIFVSVESVRDAEFRRIRGGKLDRVRRGVRALLSRRDALGLREPVVGLSVTMLRSTVADLAAGIPDFYRSLGLDGGIFLQWLQEMPQYTQFYGDETRAEIPDRQARVLAHDAVTNSAALRSVIAERGKHAGFYERLYGSVDLRRRCPWLDHGLYMTLDGTYVACCHIKDHRRFALGRVGDDPAPLLAARRAMQDALERGQVPDSCRGCNTARRIVRHGAGSGSRSVPVK